MNDTFSPTYHNRHRPPRSLFFASGLVLGIMAGFTSAYAVLSMNAAANDGAVRWQSDKLVCTGHTGELFYLHNTTPHDISIADQKQVMLFSDDGKGLVRSDAVVNLPCYLPAGETVGVRIQDIALPAVLFVRHLGYRIELK